MNERMFKEDFTLYVHKVCMQNSAKKKVRKQALLAYHIFLEDRCHRGYKEDLRDDAIKAANRAANVNGV